MGLEPGIWEIAVGGTLFIAGFLLAFFTVGADRRTRARVRALETDLLQERERRASYEDAVAKHFDRTSDLFREMTHQYSSLYAHLAEGARELCAERLPALGTGFGAGVLQAGGAGEVDNPERAGPPLEATPAVPPREPVEGDLSPESVEEEPRA